MIKLGNCTHISTNDLHDWMTSALPGDKITYCIGHLAYEIHENRKKSGVAELMTVAAMVLSAALQKPPTLHLVQRKLSEMVFEYIAVRASSKMPAIAHQEPAIAK